MLILRCVIKQQLGNTKASFALCSVLKIPLKEGTKKKQQQQQQILFKLLYDRQT